VIIRPPGPGWWYQPGIFEDGDRVRDRVRLRPASTLERCGFVSSPAYRYYLPYVPLVVCPDVPDVVAEFCNDRNLDLDIVYWKFDKQIIPQFSQAGIDTSMIFGIEQRIADEVFNYLRGTVVQDPTQREFFRLRLESVRLAPGCVSMACSAEKIIQSMVDLLVVSVQTKESYYFCQVADSPDRLQFCKKHDPDRELNRLMRDFWNTTSGE
jgi:hypothetical protein